MTDGGDGFGEYDREILSTAAGILTLTLVRALASGMDHRVYAIAAKIASVAMLLAAGDEAALDFAPAEIDLARAAIELRRAAERIRPRQ